MCRITFKEIWWIKENIILFISVSVNYKEIHIELALISLENGKKISSVRFIENCPEGFLHLTV